jgi:hypothetical protein
MIRATGRYAKVFLMAPILLATFVPLHAQQAIRPTAHEPHNVLLDQFNNDGTRLFWTNTSKTRDVYFSSHSEMDNQPNGCPVCATVQIEFRVAVAGDKGPIFRNQPTMVVDGGCSVEGDPAPKFDINAPLTMLAPNTYYKWQASVIATYLTWVSDNNRSWCENDNVSFASSWQVGVGFSVPGYFSFKTP